MIKGLHKICKNNINTSDYWDRRFLSQETNNGTSALESIMEWIYNNFNKKEIFKILDVGSGPFKKGSFLMHVKEYFDHGAYFSVDISKKICESWNNSGIISIPCNLDSLPFNDNFFDIVLCSHVLEHVDDIDSAIGEIKRVARKSGIVIINSPIGDFWSLEKEHVWWIDSNINFGIGEIICSFKGNQFESLVQIYRKA